MDPKKQLQKLIDDLKTKQFREGEAKGLVETIGGEIQKQLKPAFESLAQELKSEMVGAFKDAVNSIKVEMPDIPAPQVNVNVPDVNVPEFNIPTPEVTVNVPKADTPIVNVSPTPVYFPEEMALKGIDKKSPLPVMMMGADGKPAQFPISMGGGGGRTDFFTIKDIQTSAGNSIIDNDGFVKVTGSFSVSSTPFATYYASDAVGSMNLIQVGGNDIALNSGVTSAGTQRVVHATDVGMSVSVTDVFGSTGTNVINPDGRVKVELPTGSSGLTDAELRATAVPVSQVSGVAFSVSVIDVFGSTAADVVNPDGRLKVELPTGSSGLTDTELRAAHLDVDQLSGASWSTVVNSGTLTSVTTLGSITNSVAAALVDSSGVQYSGSNAFPIDVVSQEIALGVRQVSGAANSVATQATGLNETNVGVLRTVLMTDSISSMNNVQWGGSAVATGLNENTAGVVKVYQVTSAVNSVIVNGAVDSFFAYEVMTTNKTAKSDGADIRPKADDLGRQIMRPIQARDLIFTAYTSVSNGTETTLLAGATGAYNDLIMITASNNSSAATQLDIRAVTGGNIVHTMYLPAQSGPIGFAPPVPWPQDATGNNWTIDMPDQTGTTVYVSALFSREV